MPDPTTIGASNSQTYDTSSPDVAIDAVTHLMWQRIVDPAARTWDEAKVECACLALGGYHDWRLPTRIELVSIVDFTRADPAIDAAAFPATPADYFWTSSTLSGEMSTAWYVFFLDGNTHSGDEQSTYRVRCVRSTEPPAPADDRYAVLGDGTVLDTKTKLTWERTLDPGTFVWSDANAHCASLGLSGGGWRLPNMKELQTLVDESATGPAIDRVAFPDAPSEALWTSSPLVGGPPEAWFVNFFSGVSYTSILDHGYRARCVR
jgi:hypothetical protein